MESLAELQSVLASFHKVERAQKKAISGVDGVLRYATPEGVAKLKAMQAQKTLHVVREMAVKLFDLLTQIAALHDTPEGVKTIRGVFRWGEPAYSLVALAALAAMEHPSAQKAIARRTSFLSGASKEEKALAKALTQRGPVEGSATCSACSKELRPFPIPSGMMVGTLADVASTLQIGAHHGLVCDACGAVTCPVCSGRKATEAGVREFVCGACDHRPLTTIYRA